MVLEAPMDGSQDEDDRLTAINREKFLTDYDSDMLTSREIGSIRVQKKVVQNMRSKGFSDEQIADLTGISFEYLNKFL